VRELVVEPGRRGRARRVVGEVQPEDGQAIPDSVVERVEVGDDGELERLQAGDPRTALGDRVPRRGQRHEILAGGAEREAEGEDRLLGALGGLDLRGGVERGAEAPSDPARDGLAELGQAGHRRVAGRLPHRGDEGIADARRDGLGGVAESEVEQAGGVDPELGERGALVGLEGGERVGREIGEREGGQGHDATSERMPWARARASTRTCSPAVWAWAGSPGPKLIAGMPA
jgi:hypothetical protein